MKIILASQSPRRQEILKEAGLSYEIIPSKVDEKFNIALSVEDAVMDLAYQKASWVYNYLQENDSLIIGADTIVVLDNKILGKPKDKEEAYKMWQNLSGKTHFVVTSIAIINSKNLKSKVKSTTTYVTFENLSYKQIEYYIENYKPFDKAGAYGIQELPQGYVKNFEGSFDNVIGLPIETLLELLKENYS